MALAVAIRTSPFAPLLRKEMLSKFSIFESETSKVVLPLDRRHGFNLRDETIAGDVLRIGSGLLDSERWDLLQNEFRCEQSCGLTEKKGATQRPDAGRPRDRCAHNFHSYKMMISDRPDPNNINLGYAAYAVGLTRAFSIN